MSGNFSYSMLPLYRLIIQKQNNNSTTVKYTAYLWYTREKAFTRHSKWTELLVAHEHMKHSSIDGQGYDYKQNIFWDSKVHGSWLIFCT